MAPTLSCFISDDRHQVQTLRLLVGVTPEVARRLAVDDLRENPHHLAIEVRDGDDLLFSLDRGQVEFAGQCGHETEPVTLSTAR